MELCVCELQQNKKSLSAVVCHLYADAYPLLYMVIPMQKKRLQLSKIKVTALQLGVCLVLMGYPKWHNLTYWCGWPCKTAFMLAHQFL